MPRVSVVMPVYNTKQEYLEQAIESVLNQTFYDFELIIIDDCSDTYVKNIIDQYLDKRIVYCRLLKNSGAAAARNKGISIAKGDLIAFMDSDDISLANRFELQVDFLDKNNNIGCLGCKTRILDEEFSNCYFPKPTNNFDIVKYLLFEGCVFCQSSVMLRKDILDYNNISYDLNYVPAEDYALWLDLIGKTEFAVIEKELVIYRSYKENLSHRKKILQQQKCIEAKLNTWIALFNFQNIDIELWKKFLNGEILALNDFKIIEQNILYMTNKLYNSIYYDGLLKILKDKIIRFFYHIHGFKGQLQLFNSPLGDLLNISYNKRLFCFITRSIF